MKPLLIFLLLAQLQCFLSAKQAKDKEYKISIQDADSTFQKFKKEFQSLLLQKTKLTPSERDAVLSQFSSDLKLKFQKMTQLDGQQFKTFLHSFVPPMNPQIPNFEDFSSEEEIPSYPSLGSYLLNSILLPLQSDILELDSEHIMIALQALTQLASSYPLEEIKTLFNFILQVSTQVTPCQHISHFVKVMGQGATYNLLADLGLYDIIEEVADGCEFDASCTQTLRTKILPFFFKYQASYNSIAHSRFVLQKNEEGFKQRSKKLSFLDLEAQMTENELTLVIDQLNDDLYKFTTYSAQLKKMILFCCWRDVSQRHSHSALYSQIQADPTNSLLIKLGRITHHQSNISIDECVAQALTLRNPELILLLLERFDLSETLQIELVRALSDIKQSQAPFWLFKLDSSLSQAERTALLLKSVHYYSPAYYYLIENEQSGLSCGERLYYAQLYLAHLAQSLISEAAQESQEMLNRESSLFRTVLGYFQNKEYYPAFYISLILGEIGFPEGYLNAGFLIDSELVDHKHVCRLEKIECALAFYLKAAIKGGDMKSSVLASIDIYTKAKDIDKLETHFKLYEEFLLSGGDKHAYSQGAQARLQAAKYLQDNGGMRYAVELIQKVLEMEHEKVIPKSVEYERLREEYEESLHLFSYKSDQWKNKILSTGAESMV